MILEIVTYGHPALRSKGKPVEKIDEHIRQLAEDMLDTMYENDGVGLAAQQVGLPLQMCVIDVSPVRDRPSTLWIDGKKVPIKKHMPLVLINPTIELLGESESGPEGCLSFPGISAEIARPSSVRVHAQDIEGRTISFEAAGLLSRAVQHEYDHLQGVLFIDRMTPEDRKALEPEIEKLRSSVT